MQSVLFFTQSEVIVITEKQIDEFERMEKLFLFESNLNDENFIVVSDLPKRKANISLERLSLPKKHGGMNLRRIEDIFSASKTKVLMRALQDEGKQKYCNLLIFEKAEPFVDNCAKDHLIHPFCWFEQNTRNIGSKWGWYKQASKLFDLVDKDCTYIPEVGDVIFDAIKEKVTFSKNKN